MVKKKLISILVALSVITSMGMTGVYADEPTDATVTMEATEVVTDTATEATEVETATDIATEPTEETGVSTEVGTENTEVTDDTTEGSTENTESTETTTTVVEGEPMTATGGLICFDTHTVPLEMFNGVTYKIIDVESGAEVSSGSIKAENNTTTSADIELNGTFTEGRKYKVILGNFGAEMSASCIDIVSCQASARGENELEFTPVSQVDEGKKYFGGAAINVKLQYAEGNFIKVYNKTRQGKPIKGVTVYVTYRGSTKPYVTDDTGYFTVPIYDNDWDITVAGQDNENHILRDTLIRGNEMYSGSIGLFEHSVMWADGDTHYSIWGYNSDCSAIIKPTVNHKHDTSLYSEADLVPNVTIGVFNKDGSASLGEFVVGNDEFKLPAYDKGEYTLKVINGNGYAVKFSKNTFTAGNDETITAEFTPRHYLTVVKKVGGKVVNASFTIKDKKYESAGEYTFETHPVSTFTVTDNDTKEEFEVTIPPQYEGVILTLGDNPDVELVGLIEDKGDGSTTGGSVVGSNSNPKTYDGIMGVAAGLSLCGVGAGYLIYRKKKKFNF